MKSELYPKIYLWLVAHRRLVFFLSILLAAGCLGISSRFTMEEDVLGILPQGDRIVDEYKYSLKKFREKARPAKRRVGLPPDRLELSSGHFSEECLHNVAFNAGTVVTTIPNGSMIF